MSTNLQTSLSKALDLPLSCEQECSVQLTPDIGFGHVSVGGYVACVMAKYALFYASKHAKLHQQSDLRSSVVQFFRPVFPTKPVRMTLREVSVGKAWSTLRVELFQNEKIAVSADLIISNLSIPGITVQTGWQISPPPRRVDLAKLETDSDPDWACYHCAFYPDGYRRGTSYVKTFFPTKWPDRITFVEQWVQPGWDSLPCSGPVQGQEPARWLNDMVQFILDMTLPVQENHVPWEKGEPLPMGSIAATLGFAAAQRKARADGKADWRPLTQDGSKAMAGKYVHVTLMMSTEIKKPLPSEGMRWVYMRTEVKRIQNGRMDMQTMLCDETMDLVAVSHQVAQIIPAAGKKQKL